MTTTLSPETFVCDLVTARPARARVFDRYDIDYYCGGEDSLENIAAKHGIKLDQILYELQTIDEATVGTDLIDWLHQSPDMLIDNLLASHHMFTRAEYVRITALFQKVMNEPGIDLKDIGALWESWRTMHAFLSRHQGFEEGVVFPEVKRITHMAGVAPLDRSVFNDCLNVVRAEHHRLWELLGRMKERAHGYVIPQGASQNLKDLIAGLREFQANTALHLHKENHVLLRVLKEKVSATQAPSH